MTAPPLPSRVAILPTLTGPGVKLRHIVSSDAGALRTIFGDPRVARFMGIPLLRSEEQTHQLLQDIASGIRDNDLLQWGVTRIADDSLVGTCTLAGIDWANERAEVGFALGSSHWGRGLMRSALPLLIDHAFASLKLHRLEADVDPRNHRSLRLLELLGFCREGHLRERHLVAGERQDSILLGLLSGQWRNSQPGA